uniref:T-box domain-containing protein n=1 Tax=Amphiprion percula TaxID=161767 RepID=A0A3P8RR65_AMPPE
MTKTSVKRTLSLLGQRSCSREANGSHVEETDFRGRRNMSPSRENLAPESICRGVRVTLDNNSMWNEFYRCRTEMILTKQGSRMFPYCRFRISGLHPSKKYTLIMDIQPLENSCYKWTGNSWQVAGKAESHIKSQPFAHPESPATGQHWMQSPVSFYRLKLTNNGLDQEGNTILHPMHRYLPRLHVVQTDRAAKDIKLNGPSVLTFTFSQTEFMAVTAYQNTRFTQLKVDYNPFAKGLKEDGCSSQKLQKDEGTPTIQQHPVKKSLKSLLANHKPRSSNTAVSKPSDVQKNSTTNKDPSAAKALGETPSHPEPQSLNTTTPPPDSPPSFRESEQSLPFPAELSPLALQLPLSPTFSSLDGEGLSPTPSIADLVHFFSTDDDLGMGVEFPNTEAMAVPCLPPPAVEVQEPSPQVQPVPVNKPYKRKKYPRRKQPRINLNQKTDDTAYRSMRPNLEEVEEQLFVSFTSKVKQSLFCKDLYMSFSVFLNKIC